MNSENLNTSDDVSLKLIGPDGSVKSDTTGNGRIPETRERFLLSFLFWLLNEQEKKHA